MNNIMEQYIEVTEKNIREYMKIIFNYHNNDEIISEFITTYINIRYYNIYNGNEKSRPFYLKIMDEINKKSEKIKQNYGPDKEKIIENIKKVFNYILFFDNVRKVENFKSIDSIKEIINELVGIREKEFGIKNKKDFKDKLYEKIIDDMIKKEIYIDSFENEDFSLEFQRINQTDIYNTFLKYNLKMPKEYSKEAIDKVFNKSIISEDKLEIEYLLLSIVVLKDILEGNFKDIYIAEFKCSLFKKEQKLNKILKIIDNQALQEKINLNITYEELIKNKNKVLKYVKEGYKFAITLDNSMKNIEEMEKLKMFRIIVVPDSFKLNKKIKNKTFIEKNNFIII